MRIFFGVCIFIGDALHSRAREKRHATQKSLRARASKTLNNLARIFVFEFFSKIGKKKLRIPV